MKSLIALISGLLFGSGIVVSGMHDPSVVLGFFDPLGDFNPAFCITATTAAMVYAGMRWFRMRRGRPFAAPEFLEPTNRKIDAPLLIGASVFGSAWGIAGMCPGGGLANLGAGGPDALAYMASLTLGLLVGSRLVRALPAMRARLSGRASIVSRESFPGALSPGGGA